jgi:hypothetical protein
MDLGGPERFSAFVEEHRSIARRHLREKIRDPRLDREEFLVFISHLLFPV